MEGSLIRLIGVVLLSEPRSRAVGILSGKPAVASTLTFQQEKSLSLRDTRYVNW